MAKEKDIESCLNELKDISARLSSEEIKLEEAMALYRQGAEVAKQAEKMLERYQKEIEIINTQESESGADV